MYLDSKIIFINLAFDTSTSQIRYKLLEIYRLKDRVLFSKEAGFGNFGVNNFYGSQKQGIFIYVITSWTDDKIIGFTCAKQE